MSDVDVLLIAVAENVNCLAQNNDEQDDAEWGVGYVKVRLMYLRRVLSSLRGDLRMSGMYWLTVVHSFMKSTFS